MIPAPGSRCPAPASGGTGPPGQTPVRKIGGDTRRPVRAFPALVRRPLWIPVLLLVALAVGGCAVRRAADLPAAYDSPEAALHAVARSAPHAETQTITATARILIERPGERHSLKAALMMKRPASLRVESIPILGPPDFFLSVADGELRVFLPGEGGGKFYTGPADPRNFSRFFPVFLPPAELVPLLMGLPPEDGEKGAFRLNGEWEKGLYRIDRYEAGRKIRSLWIDPAGDHVIRIRTFGEGKIVGYTADFSEHVRLNSASLPQYLEIRGEGIPQLTIRYADLQPLADDPPPPFTLPVPEGVVPFLLE